MASKYLKQPFDAIFGVKALAVGHPVYLLQMEDDSGIVIKREDSVADTANLKHNLSVMKAVNPQSQGKLMSAAELQTVQDYLTQSALYAKYMKQGEDADTAELRLDLAAYQNRSGWIKMAEAPGLVSIADAMKSLQTNDKQGARAIAKALNAQAGFETLGRIVAADLYNHNTDRFCVNTGPTQRDAGQNPITKERFRVLQNLGNVLVSVQKKDRVILGLDSYDPSSDYHDVSKSITKLDDEASTGVWWSGRLLASGARKRLEQYCTDIYLDLEEALGPRNRRFAFLNQKRLDPKGATRILKGVEQGRQLINAKLSQLVLRAGAIPPKGLQSRLNITST